MLSGQAPRNHYSACTMRREQQKYFVRPCRCMLANGIFFTLVCASPPKIENGLKITKLEFNNLVFELAPSIAFDNIYVVSLKRQQAL